MVFFCLICSIQAKKHGLKRSGLVIPDIKMGLKIALALILAHFKTILKLFSLILKFFRKKQRLIKFFGDMHLES